VAGGERAAERDFEAVFRHCFDYVFRVACALAGPEAADDVTQEAFIVARRRMPELGPDSARAWLFAIVRNVARNHVRGRLRRQACLRTVPEPPPHAPPDDHVALRQAAELLDAFLATLPEAQREAFVAMELEGLTARTVAAMEGVPTRTIYSRVRVARQAFDRFAGALDRSKEATS